MLLYLNKVCLALALITSELVLLLTAFLVVMQHHLRHFKWCKYKKVRA